METEKFSTCEHSLNSTPTPGTTTFVVRTDEPSGLTALGLVVRESIAFPYCTCRDVLNSLQVLRC